MRSHLARHSLLLLASFALLTAACTASDSEGSAGASDTTGGSGSEVDSAGEVGSAERCDANKAAGKITYLSGFDYAASPGILDVLMASQLGYFEELCLDVEVLPGFAPGNLGLVASGEAQFANAGSLGDVVTTNVNGEADLVAVQQYGKVAIQALVVPADSAIESLSDIPGTLMGIKGDLPPDIEMMLSIEGVTRGDFDELEVPFDPFGAFELGIDSLPVYKSNEPGQLDAAGFEYRTFDPVDFGVPSSFGVLATSSSFLNDHPTAVQDFIRAVSKGFAYAVDNPEDAVARAVEQINLGDNVAFLTTESETGRWAVESALVLDSTAGGEGPGIPDLTLAGEQVQLLTDIGRFETLPDWESMVDAGPAAGIYDGTEIIWPAGS
ncbi:MAG: ABC transporter substrate-binding protein [Acidimicrobiales bacterium]